MLTTHGSNLYCQMRLTMTKYHQGHIRVRRELTLIYHTFDHIQRIPLCKFKED